MLPVLPTIQATGAFLSEQIDECLRRLAEYVNGGLDDQSIARTQLFSVIEPVTLPGARNPPANAVAGAFVETASVQCLHATLHPLRPLTPLGTVYSGRAIGLGVVLFYEGTSAAPTGPMVELVGRSGTVINPLMAPVTLVADPVARRDGYNSSYGIIRMDGQAPLIEATAVGVRVLSPAYTYGFATAWFKQEVVA